MQSFAIVNPQSYEIHGTYQAYESLFDGKPDSWPHVVIPEGLDPFAIMIACKCDSDGNLLIVEDVERKQALDARRMKLVREERNKRLQQSDWTVLPDVTMSEDKKNQWLAYRQALRDLPSTVGDPCNVTWPESP